MVWKKVFHGMENSGKVFPWCGKNAMMFSIVWKNQLWLDSHAARGRAVMAVHLIIGYWMLDIGY
jgi:hypothetical protein